MIHHTDPYEDSMTDRAEQIAAAEAAGDYALAGRLKAEQLREPHVPTMTPEQREKRVRELVDGIAEAEAQGNRALAGNLKAEWNHLLAQDL